MHTVAIISDLGPNSHRLAAIQGKILNLKVHDINFIHLSHNIEPYNIDEAAFYLKSCFQEFPANTIFLIGVNTNLDSPRHLLFRVKNYWFISNDNGFLNLFTKEVNEVFLINDAIDSIDFVLKEKYLEFALVLIKSEYNPSIIATKTNNYLVKNPLKPVSNDNKLTGIIIYIDRYENAYTNISKDEVVKFKKDRKFEVVISRHERLKGIRKNFMKAREGEVLAKFDENNFLMIAVKKGNAATLFGLKIGSSIILEII